MEYAFRVQGALDRVASIDASQSGFVSAMVWLEHNAASVQKEAFMHAVRACRDNNPAAWATHHGARRVRAVLTSLASKAGTPPVLVAGRDTETKKKKKKDNVNVNLLLRSYGTLPQPCDEFVALYPPFSEHRLPGRSPAAAPSTPPAGACLSEDEVKLVMAQAEVDHRAAVDAWFGAHHHVPGPCSAPLAATAELTPL